MSRRLSEHAIYQQALIGRVTHDCNHDATDDELFQMRLLLPSAPSTSHHLQRILAAATGISVTRIALMSRASVARPRAGSGSCDFLLK